MGTYVVTKQYKSLWENVFTGYRYLRRILQLINGQHYRCSAKKKLPELISITNVFLTIFIHCWVFFEPFKHITTFMILSSKRTMFICVTDHSDWRYSRAFVIYFDFIVFLYKLPSLIFFLNSLRLPWLWLFFLCTNYLWYTSWPNRRPVLIKNVQIDEWWVISK